MAEPKRILSIDGGGIRGILAVRVLQRLEQEVCNKDETLADHFDLVGGTSTGALVATLVALGRRTDEIAEMYHRLGRAVFEPQLLRFGIARSRYPDAAIDDVLREECAGRTLGSDDVRTNLAIVMKRIDTGSPWVVHNNPKGKFYDTEPGDSWVANKDFELDALLRASTAAPTYFSSKEIEVGRSASGAIEVGEFVDGGVSPHNNPALQLVMLAVLDGYGFRWPPGAGNLHLVSVGTGSWKPEPPRHGGALARWARRLAAVNGISALQGMMADASALNQLLMQWFGTGPGFLPIDAEVGTLAGDALPSGPLLTYSRLDVHLDSDWLSSELAIDMSKKDVRRLRRMDRRASLDLLDRIGTAYGKSLSRTSLLLDELTIEPSAC